MADSALSASRAKDFMQCPLLFRLRTIDRVPETPGLVAIRGTCIHSALEHLYDVDPSERLPHTAHHLFDTAWGKWRAEHPDDYAALCLDEDGYEAVRNEAHSLIDNYFQLEAPQNLSPAAREQFCEAISPAGIRLRGIIDRIDKSAYGTRIVDYKSGKSPHPAYIEGALFQMKFYALMYRLIEGELPKRLQLLYLRDAKSLTLDPSDADIRAINTEITGIWKQIEHCITNEYFAPRRSKLCDWCNFQSLCPAFGGTPPELQSQDLARVQQINTKKH